MPEKIDPAPTVDFESITFRCSCGEVISGAWDAAYVLDDECPECGAGYAVHAELSVDITVRTADGSHYCDVTY